MALLGNKGVNPQGDKVDIPVSGIAVMNNTPLQANQEWNSGIIPYNGNDSVHLSLASDVPGVYRIEYYVDGEKIGFMGNPTAYDPEVNASFQSGVAGKGDAIRLVYTNGPVAQSRFYCEIRLGDNVQNTSRSLGTPPSSTNLAGVTHAVIEGLSDDGSFKHIGVSDSGAMKVELTNSQEPTDISNLAKDDTLRSGAARVVLVDGNNQNRGTQASPLVVSDPGRPSDYAKESGNLAAILAKISGNPATEATLAQVLSKLSADPSTEATLKAILNKLIPNPATETTLLNILAKISSDPATQSTLAAVLTKLNAGIAVTGQFYQATQPVSLASQPLPTDASTSALQTALNTLIGALNTAQATGSSGSWSLLALLKGILQRPSTVSTVSVTTTGASSVILAANLNRKGATIFSISGTILINLGATASASAFTARIITNGYFEVPFGYTGVISAIGAGTISVTELT